MSYNVAEVLFKEEKTMNKQQIYYMLDHNGYNYFSVDHPAVFTIEEMKIAIYHTWNMWLRIYF